VQVGEARRNNRCGGACGRGVCVLFGRKKIDQEKKGQDCSKPRDVLELHFRFLDERQGRATGRTQSGWDTPIRQGGETNTVLPPIHDAFPSPHYYSIPLEYFVPRLGSWLPVKYVDSQILIFIFGSFCASCSLSGQLELTIATKVTRSHLSVLLCFCSFFVLILS